MIVTSIIASLSWRVSEDESALVYIHKYLECKEEEVKKIWASISISANFKTVIYKSQFFIKKWNHFIFQRYMCLAYKDVIP
jgi:hypothetical protein